MWPCRLLHHAPFNSPGSSAPQPLYFKYPPIRRIPIDHRDDSTSTYLPLPPHIFPINSTCTLMTAAGRAGGSPIQGRRGGSDSRASPSTTLNAAINTVETPRPPKHAEADCCTSRMNRLFRQTNAIPQILPNPPFGLSSLGVTVVDDVDNTCHPPQFLDSSCCFATGTCCAGMRDI